LELIKENELSGDIRVILIAENYDPEVIITSNWLSTQYGINITAFSVGLHKIGSDLILEVDQKYPLPELSEAYESRRKKKTEEGLTEVSWEEIIPKLNYEFAKKGIELCKKIRPGDPKRRRFGDIRKNFEGFNWISLNFREKYINVYTGCDDKQLSSTKILDIFGSHILISEWRDGISFSISETTDFNILIKWLKLE
jgi:hypothetical protein